MTRPTAATDSTLAVDGWITLDDALTPAEVASTLGRCEELLALPPAERFAGDKPAAGTRHLFGLDTRSGDVARLLASSAIVDAVRQIVGPDARLDQASFRCPQPGFGAQKLHADDAPKLDDDPSRVATAIVALVEFTDTNGATRVVPGSHRRPDLQRRSGSLDSHPDEMALT
ncbi:MAG: phytanoyl-CoA dioxygenase family protein, partial [Actinomycetota bacterium]